MRSAHLTGLLPATRIVTSAGEIAVESLRPGDQVLALGAARLVPVRCLRRRTLPPSQAVRIAAGAFGDGRPVRDLLVAPDQALLIEGALVAAKLLLNGVAVAQPGPTSHASGGAIEIELDRPDAVLADGMPAETWPPQDAGLSPGPALDALRSRLAAGWPVAASLTLPPSLAGPSTRLTDDPALHLLADGIAMWPKQDGALHRFQVPPGCRVLRLMSRAAVPSRVSLGNADQRLLGVAVDCLCIDGRDIGLDDPALRLGWHGLDGAPPRVWRWTSGDAMLPLGKRIDIGVSGTTPYPALDNA